MQSATTPMSETLDRDTPETVRLTVDDATRIGLGALRRIGYDDEEAGIIVEQLVDNSLCGYKFAGLPRILAIAGDEKTRQPHRAVKVVHETPVSALIDGGNNVGYIVAHRAGEIAIRKARESGVASVGAYDSYYSGRNAFFVEKIARAGLVAMHVASGKPRALPPGSARPALGTNPIAFGFPAADGPVVFDMGTASLMWGEVMLHAQLGMPLPEGIGFDERGEPTRDAAATLRGGVAPFDGHKGYGLSFAVQALGLLAGASLARGQVLDYGFLFWVVDPGVMLPGADFGQLVSEMVRQIKSRPRRPGFGDIRVPGERAASERQRRQREGIVLERKVLEALQSL